MLESHGKGRHLKDGSGGGRIKIGIKGNIGRVRRSGESKVRLRRHSK